MRFTNTQKNANTCGSGQSEAYKMFKELEFNLPNQPTANGKQDIVLVEKASLSNKTTYRFYQPEADAASPCSMCVNQRECIAASYLIPSYNKNYHKAALDLRKWWASHVKHLKQPETEPMRQGKERHAQLTEEHNVTKNLTEVFEALEKVGQTIRWSARVCSRSNGIRGQPDMIESTRVSADRIHHKIVEWKSHPSRHRKYFPQAVVYSLILSDPRMIANGLYFYDHVPTDQNINVDIDFDFYFYGNNQTRSYQFVRSWKFVGKGEDGHWPDGTEYGAEFVFGVKRQIKKFSGLSRVKNISDIPRCGYCPCVDSSWSAINGGDKRPEDLCFMWPLCRTDLLSNNSKQHKLGRWIRKRPCTEEKT